MKIKRFTVPLYNFTGTFAELDEGIADAPKIAKLYKEMDIDQETIDKTTSDVSRGCHNGGDTFYNFAFKKFLIVVYPCNSERMRRNIVAHESRHLADRILEWASVNDIEAAAFLQGYIAENIY